MLCIAIKKSDSINNKINQIKCFKNTKSPSSKKAHPSKIPTPSPTLTKLKPNSIPHKASKPGKDTFQQDPTILPKTQNRSFINETIRKLRQCNKIPACPSFIKTDLSWARIMGLEFLMSITK
jgi:hypothetical protein